MKKTSLILFTFVLLNNSVMAVTIPDVMKQQMTYDYGMPSLFQLVFSMIFVISLIYLTGWIYQKLNLVNKKQLSKITKDANSYRFNVLQSMSLGQQRHIYTLEINGKILLVGSTPTQINLIKEFDKTESVKLESLEVLNEEEKLVNKESSSLNKSVDIDELYKKYKN